MDLTSRASASWPHCRDIRTHQRWSEHFRCPISSAPRGWGLPYTAFVLKCHRTRAEPAHRVNNIRSGMLSWWAVCSPKANCGRI